MRLSQLLNSRINPPSFKAVHTARNFWVGCAVLAGLFLTIVYVRMVGPAILLVPATYLAALYIGHYLNAYLDRRKRTS